MTLPDTCQAPVSPPCGKRRYRFRGYCPDHDPNPTPPPAPRCVSPIRCYCEACHTREALVCDLPAPHQVRGILQEAKRRHLEVVK